MSYKEFISSYEMQALEELRIKFNSLNHSPLQLLEHLYKYKSLLEVNKDNILSIREDLKSERIKLLQSLDTLVERIIDDYNRELLPQNNNISKLASDILTSKQIIDKIQNILEKSKIFLIDLREFRDFQNRCEEIISICQQDVKHKFEDWMGEIQDKIIDRKSSSNSKIIKIDKLGLYNSTFTDDMVVLLKESRILQTYNFKLTKEIASDIPDLENSYNSALIIKRITIFYNNLNTTLIPCHKQILLGDLLLFEKAIQECNEMEKMNFNDTNKEVKKLSEAAENLTRKIETLQKLHLNIGQELLNLMKIDSLIRKEVNFS